MVVTKAVTGARPGSGAAVRKRGAATSKTVRATGGAPPICSRTSAGSSGTLSGPTTRSTCRMRARSLSPSCCAMQPATAMTRSGLLLLRGASLPTSLRSFCSAFSRTLHVLKTMRSASAGVSTATPPAPRRTPAIRSESCTFIWQPKVCSRYRKPTGRSDDIAGIGLRGPGVRRACAVRVFSGWWFRWGRWQRAGEGRRCGRSSPRRRRWRWTGRCRGSPGPAAMVRARAWCSPGSIGSAWPWWPTPTRTRCA